MSETRPGPVPIVRPLVRVALTLTAVLLAIPAVVVGAFTLANRTNGSITVSDLTRRYLLHVPASYDGTHPVPLVVDLHGFVQWPANQQSVSRWSDLADEEGFIVVHPMGTGLPLRWASHTPGAAETTADIQFLTELLDTLSRDYAIDPERVYVSGISNGAGMSFVWSCVLADRIAAIGTVAGLFTYPWEACRRTRPVPLVAFHGTADPIVPYEGGPLRGPVGVAPDVRSWVADYAARNGCTTVQQFPAQGDVTRTLWTRPEGDSADIVLYTVAGGGHTWPGGRPLPEFITGPTSDDIDATRVMWEFFRQHPLR
nr:hypothetical protein [Propionibacterium sp.]